MLVKKISLAPGFSPVAGNAQSHSRFNGFYAASQQPLKRLNGWAPPITGLKPGTNENQGSITNGSVKGHA